MHFCNFAFKGGGGGELNNTLLFQMKIIIVIVQLLLAIGMQKCMQNSVFLPITVLKLYESKQVDSF